MKVDYGNPYHFRMPIRARSVEDHRHGMLNNAIAYDWDRKSIPRSAARLTSFPGTIAHNGVDLVEAKDLKDIDFLYGVFDGALIDKRPGDVLFTIISDPVQHIFDLYSYLSHWTGQVRGAERFTEGAIHFEPIVAAGLVAFVDRFLDGDRSIEVAGRRLELIEDFFRFNLFLPYDLVGIETAIGPALRRLGREVGVGDKLLVTTSRIANTSCYRRAELAQALKAEVEAYREICSDYA